MLALGICMMSQAKVAFLVPADDTDINSMHYEHYVTNDNGVPRRECFEALQVVRQPIEELVLETYGSVPGNRRNQTNHGKCVWVSGD